MSTKHSLSLGSLDLWTTHVERCTAVLRRALELLADEPLPSPLNEVALNRALYFCILTAQRELAAEGRAPLAPVIPEGHNPPAADDMQRTRRENKIPDFQWGLTDDQVADVRRSARHFVVECKCIMQPRRADWIYTEQYVAGGVRRFVTVDHGYGMDAPSGAMVGYVQAIGLDDLLTEVGRHVASEGLPPFTELSRLGESYVELTHRLSRTFGESPFELAHLWRRLSS